MLTTESIWRKKRARSYQQNQVLIAEDGHSLTEIKAEAKPLTGLGTQGSLRISRFRV